MPVFGVLCKELGFLDEDALGKAHATGIVMPIITLSIFTNLASATPEMVGGMVKPPAGLRADRHRSLRRRLHPCG